MTYFTFCFQYICRTCISRTRRDLNLLAESLWSIAVARLSPTNSMWCAGWLCNKKASDIRTYIRLSRSPVCVIRKPLRAFKRPHMSGYLHEKWRCITWKTTISRNCCHQQPQCRWRPFPGLHEYPHKHLICQKLEFLQWSAYDFGTNRNRICDMHVLLVRHCNLGPVLHRFWDTATYWLKISYFPSSLSFGAPAGCVSFGISRLS